MLKDYILPSAVGIVAGALVFVAFFGTSGASNKNDRLVETTNKLLAEADVQVDTRMLRELAGKLKQACDRNKYGLSTSDCVNIVDAREAICTKKTAEVSRGKPLDVPSISRISKDFVVCLFEA